MTMLDQEPLSDDEIRELDEFLPNAEAIEKSMDVSNLDAFLERVRGRKTIMPSEWMC